jgi:hypothetical protein
MVKAQDLRKRIVRSLRDQGFKLVNNHVRLPTGLDKDSIRTLHKTAVDHRKERSKLTLLKHEARLLGYVASGAEVIPEKVHPRLVLVKGGSEEELLFRYATLHWSIPVSSGYGRRIRFLVVDEHNGKLIGLFGLGDPVFSLAARDEWIGWDFKIRKRKLSNVMDAFVLGAVPPYSFLLCGKLIAMLVTSNEVRDAFKRKYGGALSLIRHKHTDGRLALITTSSALGRSSIYNRVRFRDRLIYQPVGFTRGSGEFHFSNGLYGSVQQYAAKHCEPTAKQDAWGSGFRNRREVVKKCLAKIGLPTDWLYHGIRREVFAVPLARNSREFLRGEHSKLLWHDAPSDDLIAFFRDRYLLPRSQRDDRYKYFSASDWRLWCAQSSQGGDDASETRRAGY